MRSNADLTKSLGQNAAQSFRAYNYTQLSTPKKFSHRALPSFSFFWDQSWTPKMSCHPCNPYTFEPNPPACFLASPLPESCIDDIPAQLGQGEIGHRLLADLFCHWCLGSTMFRLKRRYIHTYVYMNQQFWLSLAVLNTTRIWMVPALFRVVGLQKGNHGICTIFS